MEQAVKGTLAQDLMRIHRVVTRSVKVALDSSMEFAQKGFPDPATREGFYNYVHSLASLLHSHHLGEDEIAFPQVRVKMPDEPVDQLCVHHEQMQAILDRINPLVEKAQNGASDAEVLPKLTQELDQLNTLWNSHIHAEEDIFSLKKLNAAFQAYEQNEIGQKMAEHGVKHIGPDYLVLPFVFYNLSEMDRAEWAVAVPPVLTQQMIPVVWKEKWASMKPFLLS